MKNPRPGPGFLFRLMTPASHIEIASGSLNGIFVFHDLLDTFPSPGDPPVHRTLSCVYDILTVSIIM